METLERDFLSDAEAIQSSSDFSPSGRAKRLAELAKKSLDQARAWKAKKAEGIEAGLAWGPVAQATVVYVDLGVSSGMHKGVDRAKEEGRVVEVRQLWLSGAFGGLPNQGKDI